MPQTWKSWEWDQRPNRRSRPRADKPKRDAAGGTKSLPSYDATSVPASSSRSSSSPALSNDKMLEILKKIAEKDETVFDEVEKMIPVVVEEEESEQLRQQQRRLNQIRKLQGKLGKKEASIQQKEQQMQAFIQEIKQHLESEKSRHKKEVDQLSQDVEEIKQQLALLKAGKDIPGPMEEDIEETSEPVDAEKVHLRKQVVQAQQDQEEMRKQVAYMKLQMDTLMGQYQEMAGNIRMQEPLPISPEQVVKPPQTTLDGYLEDQSKQIQRDAKAPFGVRLTGKAARDQNTPYGPAKPPDGGMD